MLNNCMIKIILIGLVLSFSTLSIAVKGKNNEKQARLNEAYLAYQIHQQEFGNTVESKNYAKTAYLAGQAALDKNSIEYAVLVENYAVALNILRPSEESLPYLLEAIEIYQSFEEPSYGLVNTLLELDRVYRLTQKTRRKIYSTQRKAVKAAEDIGNQTVLIKTLLMIGSRNVSDSRSLKKEVKRGIKYLEAAHELSGSKYVESAAFIEFWLGKGYALLKKNQQAINYFEQVLTKKGHNKLVQQLALTSHAFLVDVYSRSNDKEKATEHCQAIGKLTPWNPNQESKPLYLLQPKYPRRATLNGIEGWTKIQFTVTPEGFVAEPEVVESSLEIFSNVALKAIKEWRFAPKFVDGKPVSASMVYTMEFKLGK